SDPGVVNFAMPPDTPETKAVLRSHQNDDPFEVYVGCSRWGKNDLKGFYPKGIQDELAYYSRQFNAIEMNATFYKMPGLEQVETWKSKTPTGFKFNPKVPALITHYRRLINVQEPIENFCNAISGFEDRLGMAFMQLHDNFGPKDFDRLKGVLADFPKGIPLSVEVRNADWFDDKSIGKALGNLLEKLGMSNSIIDTAGRRDMVHMRLTCPVAFVRWVGANHKSDTERIDNWIERIAQWREEGLHKLFFFVHQHIELESPLLAAYFIQGLNRRLGLQLHPPQRPGEGQTTIFG